MTTGSGTERPEARIDDRPGRAHERARLVALFTVVTMALLMQSLDVTIVATALVALRDGLDTTVSLAGWTITVYSIAMVMMLPLSAQLSDRLGRKQVFLLSVVVFATASLLCGLATNILMLIVMRTFQAIGGAGLTPSATAIVVEHFGSARDRAVSLFGTVFRIGATTGPVLGGVFVTYLSWRWIFFVNIPISAVIVLFSLKLIPPDRHRARTGRSLDFPGMALLGGGILVGMIGATFLGESSPQLRVGGAMALAAAVVILWCFLRHVHRVENPFVAPSLIHGSGFGAVNVINTLYGGATVGVMSLVPLYAITRYHIDALGAGTLLASQAIAGAVVSIVTAMALRRTGYRAPLFVGAVTGTVGMLAMGIGPHWGVSAYVWLAVAATLVGAGLAGSDPAARNAGLQLMPDQASSLAALRTMGRRIGTAVSVSIVTAIIAASPSPSIALAWSLAGFGVLLLVASPVIFRVPEHRGAW